MATTTHTRVEQMFPEAYGGDGYDFMSAAQEKGWHVFVMWGEDGWDMGEWPYLMYAVPQAVRFCVSFDDLRVLEYCEGDIAVINHSNVASMFRTLDSLARTHWRRKGMLDNMEGLRERGFGPYTKALRDKYDRVMGTMAPTHTKGT